MELALIIAGRLRQIWRPYVFGAVAAVLAVIVMAMFDVARREAGVPLEWALAGSSLLAAITGVLLAVRTEAFLSGLKDWLGPRRIGSD
jgi:hypothetical protein